MVVYADLRECAHNSSQTLTTYHADDSQGLYMHPETRMFTGSGL